MVFNEGFALGMLRFLNSLDGSAHDEEALLLEAVAL